MTVGAVPAWVKEYQTARPPLPGWFADEDLHLFALINEMQQASHVAGDLLEVGGYLAKSSVALGFMCRGNESLKVIDPWDSYDPRDDNVDWYQEASLEQFMANYQRFHDQLPDILHGLSKEQMKYLPAEQFRFIHIDGSHEWRVMSGDVDQVLRLLSPGGVVAFDDLFLRHCAGVGAAVWPACATGDLVPVATTNKLYATRGLSSSINAPSMASAIDDDPELYIRNRQPIFGSDVLEVRAIPVPLMRGLRPYVPPVLVDLARQRNLGPWVRRTLARRRRPGARPANPDTRPRSQ
jgi:hypothetical protein